MNNLGSRIEKVSVGTKSIGKETPCFVVAEIAQAHDGSLGLAHKLIDAAAEAGVDAVKFQTHIADAESTLDEPFRVKFSQQDNSRYAYWKRMEFTGEQWAGLAKHCADENLVFLSSPFSVAAVELLRRIGVPMWKIASGELGSVALLNAMLDTKVPFLVSSGMSPWREIDALVARLHSQGRDYAVMQCTSRYPTPLACVGLNVIDEMRRRYNCPVGLSDHTGTLTPATAAIARGADVVELHLTLDRRMFGPDTSSSLTVEQFKFLVEFRNSLSVIDIHPVDKDELAKEFEPLRAMFGRSLAPVRNLSKGTVLDESMLAAKKPSTGIPESQIGEIVGRCLARDVVPQRLLRWEDLEG